MFTIQQVWSVGSLLFPYENMKDANEHSKEGKYHIERRYVLTPPDFYLLETIDRKDIKCIVAKNLKTARKLLEMGKLTMIVHKINSIEEEINKFKETQEYLENENHQQDVKYIEYAIKKIRESEMQYLLIFKTTAMLTYSETLSKILEENQLKVV
ncbi:hypothetical protein Bp8pS_159 [Bacillus phage vB_BpuM-BpSp]|nr:hypothetical protein Bp8pS_159 [Bacillus phage vB_BpuM-BpSp]